VLAVACFVNMDGDSHEDQFANDTAGKARIDGSIYEATKTIPATAPPAKLESLSSTDSCDPLQYSSRPFPFIVEHW
jgi:hypothetical protein